MVALDEIDWQVSAIYDVNKLMKKINKNETKNLLQQYDKFRGHLYANGIEQRIRELKSSSLS